jgi:hypothetical protein
MNAYRVTDKDVVAARESDLSEDQVFDPERLSPVKGDQGQRRQGSVQSRFGGDRESHQVLDCRCP